jgi:Na+/melibiose symporter-like transporter
MTAQRIATFRIAALFGGPIGGFLAQFPFIGAAALCAVMHLALVPLFAGTLREKAETKPNRQAWVDAWAQVRQLVRSRTLLGAAFMIFLIALAPGFGTPILFYQTDQLGFSRQFVGNLALVSAATGLAGSAFYYYACRRYSLGFLLAASILLHTLGTLTYFLYRSPETAIFVSAVNGITGTLALLPTYDLAARATPRGSEALGYSVMMSVWNFTNAVFDWAGSWLFQHFDRDFGLLIWVNAGTTLLAIVAVPFLPKALLSRRDDGAE